MRVAVATIAVAMTVSCQPGGTTRSSLPATSPVPSHVASNGWLTSSFAQAWPRATSQFIPISQTDGREFFLNAVSPSPDWVLGYLGGPPKDPSRQGLQNPIAVLLNVSDGASKAIVKLDPSLAQGGFDTDGRFVVWVEASDPRGLDWRVLAKPVGSASTPTVIAKSDANAAAGGGSFVFPHIDHGAVVWSQMNGQVSDVYAAGADGSAPRQLTNDASSPLIGWPLVAYARHASPSAPVNQYVLGLYDLRAHRETILNDVSSPSSWAVSSYGVAWVDSSRKKLFVRDIRTGRNRLIADVSSSRTNYLQFPAMNARFVAWSQEGGEWLFDTTSGRSIQLSEHRLFNSVWLHGDTLAWPVPIPPSDPTWKPWNGLRGYYVVDTRTLA